jgi:hypothetical protein
VCVCEKEKKREFQSSYLLTYSNLIYDCTHLKHNLVFNNLLDPTLSLYIHNISFFRNLLMVQIS